MKPLAIGAAAIMAATLLGALALTAGMAIWSMLAVLACGLGGMFAQARGSIAEDRTGEAVVVGLAGVVVAVGCGIMALDQGAPLFGPTARGISVAEAPSHSAAFYHFTDGRILADRREPVLVMRSTYKAAGSYETYPYVVAPLVGDQWRVENPSIPAWVVKGGGSGAPWSSPPHAAVRVNTIDRDDIAAAIRHIERFDHMPSAGGAPLLRLVADPEAAQAAEWLRLGRIMLVGVVAWGLVLVGARIARGLRASAKSRRSRALRAGDR